MVPVLLLTGFLGSGKTTLLNRLLDWRARDGVEHAAKLALVVNELGQVGIDGDLLPSRMTRQIELPGGCICCALDEDLEKTLTQLTDEQPDLEAIVIETTGIAEPAPISWTLGRETLGKRLRLAAVITVVDALEHERHRAMSSSVDAQVDYADLFVLSKIDLATPEQIEATRRAIREQNSVAPIVDGDRDTIAAELWRALLDPSFERVTGAVEAPPDEHHHHFESVVVPIEDTLDFEELSEALEALPASFVRIKGIARVVDASTGSLEPRMVAFHRVGARVSAEPAREGTSTRVVGLGPGIDAAALASCIRAAVLTSPE